MPTLNTHHHSAADASFAGEQYQPLVICDSRSELGAKTLAEQYSLRICGVDSLARGALRAEPRVLALLDLLDQGTVRSTRIAIGGLNLLPDRSWAFAVPSGMRQHAATVQANALGATEFFDAHDPTAEVARLLSIARTQPRSEAATKSLRSVAGGAAIIATGDSIARLFSSLSESRPVRTEEVASVGLEAARSIAEVGAQDWLENVRRHHGGTFQHCLLVTGTAAAFAARHKMDRSAAVKLTLAAMLHDIGKAVVPLHILDKAGPLSEDEFAIVRSHPEVGYQHLRTQPGIDPHVLDAVRHHHEAMDGSGYPDRLRGSQITLLTRLLTVCDIYAALVEARSYKTALNPEEAILILVRMALQGKVDYDIVRKLSQVFDMTLPDSLLEVQQNLIERV